MLRERTRLAREMHDTIGHALVLISVKLEAAQRLRERDPERCDRELESTKQIARETMTALRASIAGLRSPTWSMNRSVKRSVALPGNLPSVLVSTSPTYTLEKLILSLFFLPKSDIVKQLQLTSSLQWSKQP